VRACKMTDFDTHGIACGTERIRAADLGEGQVLYSGNQRGVSV